MNNLKKLRKSKGLTQQELAKEMGTTKLTISNWENEKHTIKAEKAKQLADFFGVTVGYLLGFSDEKERPVIYTPKEERMWHEFDYLQLSRTDLSFHLYEDLRKKLDPNLLELIINYSFGNDDDKRLLRELARKLAKEHSVKFKENNDKKFKENNT
ncbi:helix-turn-helix transcriptional regulator [Streptococcus thermophilus]|uniref:helix-turn-helix domain-containing protein n=1 Tax=Streptococcus thermophilus TaxID=1308 RepID=UPI0022FDF5C1|nr:helix-turn-helix transcriptional regulator [Streptococcus thermophilus]MDA5520412.1 helix-turn-helix transcriptional regulator [Streptococcus thermophilus]MDW2957675.1 helix-turn-helix transcriptional regulator [Streptococcus thermophilus]